MVSAETLQVIETAIQIESDGLAFYSQAAAQISDRKGQQMFQSLARDEEAHKKMFESVRESLLQKNRWLSEQEIAAISPPTNYPAIFPKGDALRAAKVPEYELAALQRGIEAEEASITFYSEQMSKTTDQDARAMYAYLVGQEEGHRAILEAEYDYLTRTGFWFDIREFDLEAPG